MQAQLRVPSMSIGRWASVASLAALSVALLAWHRMAGDVLSPIAVACLVSMVLGAYLAGDLVLVWVTGNDPRFDGVAFRLVAGLVGLYATLFAASAVLPFGLRVDWLIVLGIVVLLWALMRRGRSAFERIADDPPGAMLVVAVPALITVWCRDILPPTSSAGDQLVIHAWHDVFVHSSMIAAFAWSHGPGTLSDVLMAGSDMHAYHFASYLLPALVVQATGASTLAGYAGLLVPLGLVVSALGISVLAGIAFGRWPGMAAGLGTLLVPDAFQQGFGNVFFDFHWFQQIAPAEGYGIAAAALAFAFLLQACRTGRARFIAAGWGCAILTISFKAQIFVAIAYPAFVIPVIFFSNIRPRWRVVLFVVCTCVFVAAVSLGQRIASVPAMRLDGSGLFAYSDLMFHFQQPGRVFEAFAPLFARSAVAWLPRGLLFVAYLTLCTFGGLAVFYPFLIRRITRGYGRLAASFPLMVVAVYLAMATGLSMDDRHVGMPEEIVHRPFVWAWAVVVAWCVAGSYALLVGEGPPTSSRARVACVVLLLAGIVLPVSAGHGLQTVWVQPELTIAGCRVEAARFVRERSRVDEIAQDAANDRDMQWTALTERRPYAIDVGGIRAPKGLDTRLEALASLRSTLRADDVETFMRAHAIRWYVVGGAERLPWEADAVANLAYACGDQRVYRYS